jgi:hypothetical protein
VTTPFSQDNQDTMLPLNSPRWRSLKTLCWSGLKLRDLLGRWHDAIGSPEAKAIYRELRDLFTQQYSIEEAAYAAVPHIVEELERLPPAERITCLIDLGVTELFSLQSGEPRLPADLSKDYLAAIKKAKPIAERCLSLKLSKEDFRYLVAVICILRGHPGLGELLVHFHALNGRCKKCGEYVWPQEIKDSGY